MAKSSDEQMLDQLQQNALRYFRGEVNSVNGLVADSTKEASFSSIAAVGLAFTVYPVAVERGYFTRDEAVRRTLAALRFFWHSEQSDGPEATGYKGFYYHFLDMETGLRARRSELSTIDTAILLAGALTAAAYFQADNVHEQEIRELADKLYRRADWTWACNGEATVVHGWKPESGFITYRWKGYNEALLLYILGLGSPTHPLPPESYQAFTAGYDEHWKEIYGREVLYAGSLFIHQLPQIWLDLRNIQDEPMRAKGFDYFENSRRAVYIQQEYAVHNPFRFHVYAKDCWGFTASDGPGPEARQVNGIDRRFFGYEQRGAPFGPDDGTIAPWAAVASLPFAPEIVLPTIARFEELDLEALRSQGYGFRATYNATYHTRAEKESLTLDKIDGETVWVSPWYYALNQGPIILMIENYRTELLWRLMHHASPIVQGLRRAGFTGGWLSSNS
ncbi:MAG: glucoamylase family protein [Caldilineaceae bacterium]